MIVTKIAGKVLNKMITRENVIISLPHIKKVALNKEMK